VCGLHGCKTICYIELISVTLLLFHLSMLNFVHYILWVLVSTNFLVKNFNYVCRWEVTGAFIRVESAWLVNLVVVDCNFGPISQVTWIRISRLAKILQLIKILKNHQIGPSSILTESAKLIKCQAHSAAVNHLIFKSQHWVINI